MNISPYLINYDMIFIQDILLKRQPDFVPSDQFIEYKVFVYNDRHLKIRIVENTQLPDLYKMGRVLLAGAKYI